jgi:ribosome-binding protein aMBF1 (putative translation factor)
MSGSVNYPKKKAKTEKKPQNQFKCIAKLVKNARSKAGLSQGELSNKLGFRNGQFISNIEREICSLPIGKICLFSQITDVRTTTVITAIHKDYKSLLIESCK